MSRHTEIEVPERVGLRVIEPAARFAKRIGVSKQCVADYLQRGLIDDAALLRSGTSVFIDVELATAQLGARLNANRVRSHGKAQVPLAGSPEAPRRRCSHNVSAPRRDMLAAAEDWMKGRASGAAPAIREGAVAFADRVGVRPAVVYRLVSDGVIGPEAFARVGGSLQIDVDAAMVDLARELRTVVDASEDDPDAQYQRRRRAERRADPSEAVEG